MTCLSPSSPKEAEFRWIHSPLSKGPGHSIQLKGLFEVGRGPLYYHYYKTLEKNVAPSVFFSGPHLRLRKRIQESLFKGARWIIRICLGKETHTHTYTHKCTRAHTHTQTATVVFSKAEEPVPGVKTVCSWENNMVK